MIPPRRLRNLAILSTFGLLPLQTDALPDNSHSLQDHSNGLRSLALSRPARANALIGLQFNAGSFQDTVPGLAHLAEHVFLRQHIVDARGERLALRDFLTLHGGRVSAKTSHESTYFVFEIQREAASLLLQELAELLRTPRVTTSIIASEISAVSDEFSFLKTRENWLLQDALKSATAAGHPFRRNSAGNQASFAPYSLDALKAELKSFFERYYRPTNLSLVYISAESPAQQQQNIRESFGALPVLPAANTREPPLFDSSTLPQHLHIQAPVSSRQFNLLLPLAGLSREEGEATVDYLRFWTDTDSAGSWRRQLLSTGLFKSVTLSRGIAAGNQASLSLHWVPTGTGLAAGDATWQILLQALQALAVQARNPNVLARFRAHQFRDRNRIPGYIESHHVQTWLQTLAKKRSELPAVLPSKQFLSLLDKRKLLLIELHPTLDGEQRSPVFDVPYTLQKLTQPTAAPHNATVLEAFTPPVDLRESPTLPELASQADKPKLLADTGHITTWHSATPKANGSIMVQLSLDLPVIGQSAHHRTLGLLWLEALDIASERFPDSDWYRHDQGMAVELRGTPVQIRDQLASIADMLQTTLTQAEFDALKARMIGDWQRPPDYRFAFERLVEKLRYSLIPAEDPTAVRIAALQESDHPHWLALQQQSLSALRATLYIYGGDREMARALSHALTLPHAVQSPGDTATKNFAGTALAAEEIQGGTRSTELLSESNALLRYHVTPRSTPQDEAQFQLLLPLLKRQYFATLREEQRLAYGVTVVPVNFEQQRGYALIAQSAATPPDILKRATEQFLSDFPHWLNTLTEAQLALVKARVSAELDPRALRGEQLANHYWSQISKQQTGLNWQEAVLESVRTLQPQDLSRYFDSVFRSKEGEALTLEGWPRREG